MRKTLLFLVFFLNTNAIVHAADEGEPAPACNIPHFFKEANIDFSGLKGKVVYMDFWASWCPPCKQSFPDLNELHEELKDQGFSVVAVNLDAQKQDAEDFLAEHPVTFEIAYDATGDCPRNFNVMAMPSAFIIDKKGTI